MQKIDLAKYIVPGIFSFVIIFYCIILAISKDLVYGFLIPLDYLLTFVFAFNILRTDVRTFITSKENIFRRYGIKGATRVNREDLLVLFVWFGSVMIAFITVLFVFYILLNGFPPPSPSTFWPKIVKFVVSTLIMAGSVFVFSKINGMFLVDILIQDNKTIFRELLLNAKRKK